MDKNKTHRLYYEDPYRVEFEAEIVERLVSENKPALVLDQTCFYPESGGQPSDQGTIEGVVVIKIVEEGEKIIHVLEREVTAQRIKGQVDWTARFDHMQQHSGQHILSQAFYEILKGETLSFHLGAGSSTVEIGIVKIGEEELGRVEKRANAIILEDRAIKTTSIDQEKIGDIPLRKPPKKKGLIRVVEVDGFDYSACGGTHCRRTGEIGLIKITKWERIRNNLRFEFVCGWRALADYGLKNGIVRQLTGRFSVKEGDVLASLGKLSEDLKASRKLAKKSEEKLAVFEAQEFMTKAEGKIIKEVFAEKTPDSAKFLALTIVKQGDFIVLFAAKSEARSHLILAASENLKIDMRRLVPIISPDINGKGGGSPVFVEIAGDPGADLSAALAKAQAFIKNWVC
jgi:alanyl-tRNA synthetase